MNRKSSTARPLRPTGVDTLHEDLLTRAAEAVGMGLWWFDPAADLLDGNPCFRELLLGRTDAEDPRWPLTGSEFIALLHPDDRARIPDLVRKLLRDSSGATFTETFWLQRSRSREAGWMSATGKLTLQERNTRCDRPQKRYLVGTIQALSLDDHGAVGLLTDDARLTAMLNTLPQMVWSTQPDGYHDYYNDRWYEFTGMPYGSTDGEAWIGMFHPNDQPVARDRWQRSLATGEPYEIEYRLRRHDGEYRWTLGRALPIRHPDGTIKRWFGTCTDIHDLKSSAEQRELISRELSHRIKNVFAVVSSLVNLTSREDNAVRPFATGLVQRLNSLAHVHEYVQPHNPWDKTDPSSRTVLALIEILVRPYTHDPAEQVSSGRPPDDVRLAISGADATVGAGAGTALALIIHELATNAVKYGSLSRSEGRVGIYGEYLPDGQYRLTWEERCGPTLTDPPGRPGFGTQLAHRSATGQLGALIEQDWAREGLTVRLTIPPANLAR